MSTRSSKVPEEIYQIKVSLLRTRPPIWRRLLVPASITLAQLHNVLQVAMGWSDCHLHGFDAGDRRFGPLDGMLDDDEAEDESKERLYNVLHEQAALRYTYDYGDDWEHSVVLEKRLPVAENVAYPICIAGKLACPPEDCGGPPGFYDFLRAIGDPSCEEHQEMLAWVGGKFDPQSFSIEAVNHILAPKKRPRARSTKRSSPST